MITIRGLCKRYGNFQVLSDLDLDVREGETLVILGRSGVGKSVLLKHILGLAKPDSGYVQIKDTKVSELTGDTLYHAIRGMGMLFQGAALFDSMTIGENVSFYLRQHRDLKTDLPYSEQEIAERVKDALKMVGLEGTEKKMPSDLSGGMRKRAALARLIVYRPFLLLYDEPTTGLDPLTSMQINELILRTQKELQATSVIVTHDILSALQIGDRLALHKEGKILHVAEPEKFLEIQEPLIQIFKQILPPNWSYSENILKE